MKKITKSNFLVDIKHSHKLSAIESKIMLYIHSITNLEKSNFLTVNLNELLDIAGTETHSDHIISACKRIRDKGFWINNTYTAWFSAFNYEKGVFHIEIPQLLIPHLTELKSNFTSYNLVYVLGLKSGYSIRIYEMLARHVNLKKVITLQVSKFKEMLGIETEYKQYNHLKARVLLPAQNELKRKSNLYFDFKEIKLSRRVDKIEFHIKKRKRSQDNEDVLNQCPVEISNMFKLFGFSEENTIAFLKKYSPEQIKKNLELTYEKEKAGELKNASGFAKKAIEEDYASNIKIPLRVKQKSNSSIKKSKTINEIEEFINRLSDNAELYESYCTYVLENTNYNLLQTSLKNSEQNARDTLTRVYQSQPLALERSIKKFFNLKLQ